ncbi:MAG: SAM-dependent methyltransferase, partial [Actinomycetes bacterium]
LLRRGARRVVCVDVGYGQLAWSLRTDPRVLVLDRTNVRDLDPSAVGDPVDVVVADLSFISLRLVLPALAAAAREDADLVLMVKPQFEVGRDALAAGGVVRDSAQRAGAVADVTRAAYDGQALGVAGVVASPLPGPAGNVEYFLWLRRDAPTLDPDHLASAVAEGPQ